MRFVLGRTPSGSALMVEFRSQESFDGQCLQADHIGALVLPLGETLPIGTFLDLCLQGSERGQKRWYYVVVATSTTAATTFKVVQRPTPRVPGTAVGARANRPHEPTQVLPVTLHCTTTERDGQVLLLAALPDNSLDRAVTVISQQRVVVAKLDAKLKLNSAVDVCLHTASGVRRWFEGRVVNQLPAGYAIELEAAQAELERRWGASVPG